MAPPPGDADKHRNLTPVTNTAHTPQRPLRGPAGLGPSLRVSRQAPVSTGLTQSQEGSSEPPGSAEGPLGAAVAVRLVWPGDWGGLPRDPRSVPQITLLIPADNSD